MVIISSQLNLFDEPCPYKYIIDTSAILSQKPNEKHRRTRFKTLWQNIDALIQQSIVVTSSEIIDEVDDADIRDSLKAQNCVILDVDEEIQANVTKVFTENQGLLISSKTNLLAMPF